ncbi:hypothetical protein [Photobacterium damselae]|uniref:hypothetical protein n=1 Tax=Photobacterium damselae TaxID=38293 RepID=UPI0040695D05
MSECYLGLCYELAQQKDALTITTNTEVINGIKKNIEELESQILNYDLGDDDLFECSNCHNVIDIEDSVRSCDGQLICNNCNFETHN